MRLLSREYARQRRQMIRADRAWPEMPPAGDPRSHGPGVEGGVRGAGGCLAGARARYLYVCVVDKQGNIFSATPSDGSYNAPVVPGLGIIPSPRGSQNWADPDHPSGVAPGKRPRLTPNPAIAIEPGKMAMPFGTPGGDVQTQAMLQVFLNVHLFGMEAQEAVEAPRTASYSFPSSFEPHAYHPGRLNLEGRIDRLDRRGARRPRPQGRMVARVDMACRSGMHDYRRPGERCAQGWGGPAPAVLCSRRVAAAGPGIVV